MSQELPNVGVGCKPTFEECAAVVARYMIREGSDPAESCAGANQVQHGFCKYKLLARAKEMAADDPTRFVDMTAPYQVVGEMLDYFETYRLATWAPLASIIERERKAGDELHQPRPFCDWHEDRGDVLWWRIPICEPPYIGSPLDMGVTIPVNIEVAGHTFDTLRTDVGGWPFSDTRNLWWTPLPDAKRIEDQVPL